MTIKNKLNSCLRATLLLFILLTSASTTMAQRHSFVVDGIRYAFNGYYDEYDNFIEDLSTLQVVRNYDEETDIDYGKYSGDIVIPAQVTYQGITYPVTQIGYSAFDRCDSLTSIEIPNSVISIELYAFSCSGLTSITIPNSVITIKDGAFYGCKKLKSITIPNSVTSIGDINEYNDNMHRIGAFCQCTSLEEVTIGKSVTDIGPFAFTICGDIGGYAAGPGIIQKVTCLSSTPPTTVWAHVMADMSNRMVGIFDYWYFCNDLISISIGREDYAYNPNYYDSYYATLYVPKGSVEAYRNAEDWGLFHNIVGIDVPDEPTVYGDVNGDGEVNITDVNTVINAIINASNYLTTYDVNGDGEVNIGDVNQILDIILN